MSPLPTPTPELSQYLAMPGIYHGSSYKYVLALCPYHPTPPSLNAYGKTKTSFGDACKTSSFVKGACSEKNPPKNAPKINLKASKQSFFTLFFAQKLRQNWRIFLKSVCWIFSLCQYHPMFARLVCTHVTDFISSSRCMCSCATRTDSTQCENSTIFSIWV